jgi:hypothetical protein
MSTFALAEPTPGVWLHGITGQELSDDILPVGTRYSIEGEGRYPGTLTILIAAPDGAVFRYRVQEADLNGVVI